MGQTIGVNVLQRASEMDISQQFDGYSGVRIYVGTDDDGNAIVYEAGDTTGRTLEIQNDFGTQEMANNILADILGYQYQPMDASGALLDPSAEMGDGVTVNGVYTGLFVRATTFGRLMASDIAAPTDEEIAHEYSTETAATDRAFSRFVRSTRASLSLTSTQIAAEVARATTAEESLRASVTLNADRIAAEVTRATGAEEQLSSQLTLTASQISARVTEVSNSKLDHTRTNSTFGWDLTSSSFSINSNGNTNVFYADKNGVKIRGNAEVTGKITATSGYIGNGSSGFEIRSTSIANGKSSFSDSNNGIYIGTDGIALGSKFKVDTAGNITASGIKATNMALYGTLTFYDTSGNYVGSMSAANLRTGAQQAYNNYGNWNWSTQTVDNGYQSWNWSSGEVSSNGGYWSGGASAGYTAKNTWDMAQNQYQGVGLLCASQMICGSLRSNDSISTPYMYYQGAGVDWVYLTDADGYGHRVLGNY